MLSKQQKLKQANSLTQAAAEIYADPNAEQSRVNVPDSGRHTSKLVEIDLIYPDPSQPRRVVPSAALAQWDNKPETVIDMIHGWTQLVDQERKTLKISQKFDLWAYFQPSGAERPEMVGPLEAKLLKVVDLATSFRRDKGVTNPLTIYRFDDTWRIETGERRWLAYHLLRAFFPEEHWGKILAYETKEPSIWRQASENGARDDLNAISRARQLAILLMDIYRGQGTRFLSFDEMVGEGSCDRGYYGQVADGERFIIPKDRMEDLIGAMGVKNSDQLRKYRALLRLPDEAWVLADDYNLPEKQLRPITSSKLSDEEKIERVHRLILALLPLPKARVSQDTASKSNSNETPTEPITITVPDTALPKLQQIKARIPEASDDQIIEYLMDFWLEHATE